jgi:hypothetical protein
MGPSEVRFLTSCCHLKNEREPVSETLWFGKKQADIHCLNYQYLGGIIRLASAALHLKSIQIFIFIILQLQRDKGRTAQAEKRCLRLNFCQTSIRHVPWGRPNLLQCLLEALPFPSNKVLIERLII